MDRLAELFPGLEFEERRPGLYRAEEDTPLDADGLEHPPHWRYALVKGGDVATLIADKVSARTEMDEEGLAEMFAMYHLIGRVR
jgi:hypothetical protein